MNIFRRTSDEEKSLGDRLPPGQYQTKKWPVLHYGSVPKVNEATWDFRVSGLVDKPRSWSLDEIRGLQRTSVRRDAHCVTRWSLFDADWEGVRLTDLLDMVSVQASAHYALVHAEQGYTTNLPLADLTRDDVLLVDTWNGQPLTPDHGWPLRLFVPHLYLWKSAKWVRGIELMADDKPGFWEGYGYHRRGDPWREERYDSD